MLSLTLVESALRGRKLTLARALLAERTALKPESPFNWATTIRALRLLGDERGTEEARRRSATLRPLTELASAA